MLRLPQPRRVTLSSGATLLYQRNPVSPTVAFGVFIARGSRHERETERGYSHFLEHMVFRGTRRRTALQIAYELEAIGGQYDAFTGKESTCYTGKVLEEHFGKLADLLADIVCSPTIPPDAFRLEKKVIQEEIRSIQDSPEETAHELFAETMYRGNSLGHPITGYLRDVARCTRDDLVRYHRRAYRGGSVYLGFVGNLPIARVIDSAERLFSFPPSGRAAPPAGRIASGRIRSLVQDELVQSHVCIGSRTVSAAHPDRHALVILASILGGGATSRLFQGLRDRTGLVYSVYTTTSFWRDEGSMVTFFSVDAKNLERALGLFLDEVRDLRAGGVRDEEIESARAQLKGSIVFGMESVENRLFRLVQSEFYHGRYIPCRELIRDVERVGKREVTEAALKYLDESRLTYATCGPVSLRGKVPL